MARPKKADHEKRDKRLTYYMTEEEAAVLNSISEHLGIEKTKCISQALNLWIRTLENPPETLKQARFEEIMKSNEEEGNGYICSKGHTFWIQWTWPSPPDFCPCCGDRFLKRTWAGRILRGLGF